MFVHSISAMLFFYSRRAVRATLILIPLLGLQYIALPFKPPPGSDGEYVYSMISAFLVSFQVSGIIHTKKSIKKTETNKTNKASSSL